MVVRMIASFHGDNKRAIVWIVSKQVFYHNEGNFICQWCRFCLIVNTLEFSEFDVFSDSNYYRGVPRFKKVKRLKTIYKRCQVFGHHDLHFCRCIIILLTPFRAQYLSQGHDSYLIIFNLHYRRTIA